MYLVPCLGRRTAETEKHSPLKLAKILDFLKKDCEGPQPQRGLTHSLEGHVRYLYM